MRTRQIATIIRFTLLEARRTRLFWLFCIVLALISGAAWFLQELAITESARMQLAFSAAAIRFSAVCVLSLHIITSITREFNDKGLELTLAFDLPRSHYILGRLCGFILTALLLSAVAVLPLLWQGPLAATALWGLSLALELSIVAALSLFCIITFTQLMPAASFVFGFYLLARAFTAIRLITAAPLTGADELSHRLMAMAVDALALVLPALDHYAQTSWLIDVSGALPWPMLGSNAIQALIYICLLAMAAIFDFSRRNL